MDSAGDRVIVIKKADIDTRAPFRSVREAVSLFGEKVLAGELYSDKIKEMQFGAMENGQDSSKLGTVTAELEETKLSLQKAKEESMIMASYLSSLREELERTKRELQQLKVREAEMESEIEDVKVVEDSTKFEVKMQSKAQEEEEGGEIEFQNKRYVTFANPPSLAQGIVPQGVEALGRHPCLSKKTKKKNTLIPLIGGILSKTKATHKLYSS